MNCGSACQLQRERRGSQWGSNIKNLFTIFHFPPRSRKICVLLFYSWRSLMTLDSFLHLSYLPLISSSLPLLLILLLSFTSSLSFLPCFIFHFSLIFFLLFLFFWSFHLSLFLSVFLLLFCAFFSFFFIPTFVLLFLSFLPSICPS